MAILEGMASRLPLIATAVGAVPTVIRNGVTGILLPPHNPDLLASAIIELLQNPSLRTQLGAAARKQMEEEYSASRVTSDYLAVYQAVIAARPFAAPPSRPPMQGTP